MKSSIQRQKAMRDQYVFRLENTVTELKTSVESLDSPHDPSEEKNQ